MCEHLITCTSIYRWSSGTDIVVYQSTAVFNNEMMTLTSKTVGQTQDWVSSTVENGRGYAVQMGVTDSKFYFQFVCHVYRLDFVAGKT